MMQPGMMMQPVMMQPVMAGSPSDIIFMDPSNALEIHQEKHCYKHCLQCCCMVGADKFQGKTAMQSFLIEEADWCARNPMAMWLPCCSRKTMYNLDLGSQNALKYDQELNCLATNGYTAKVHSSGATLGVVGLPRVCCGLGKGCSNCAFDCASWGGCMCTKMGFLCCSLEYCLCAGCHVAPTRAYDNNSNLLFNTSAFCCQLGILCSQWCCDPCQTTNFDTKDVGGAEMGKIIRFNDGGCVCQAANKFTVQFPPQATRQTKELMFASAISLHTLYYDF